MHPLPIQLAGWDPGIGWALIESFDASVLFPRSYASVHLVNDFSLGEHDNKTSRLLANALRKPAKQFLFKEWNIIRGIRIQALTNLPAIGSTRTRYRIGLLHLFLFYRIIERIIRKDVPQLTQFINLLVEANVDDLNLDRLAKKKVFTRIGKEGLYKIFKSLSNIYVRTGKKAKMFCALEEFSTREGAKVKYRIRLNDDLKVCLNNLKEHVANQGLFNATEHFFALFDQAYGVNEALDDLADFKLVEAKEAFVRSLFADVMSGEQEIDELLQCHSKEISSRRKSVSPHYQNWVFEMLLYLTGLNSIEDIHTRFKECFECSGHSLRPHAPYGDHAKAVAFMLQGRDVCEQWSPRSKKGRTLTEDEFRRLAWSSVAKCIWQAFIDRGGEIRSKEEVIQKYLGNKSMRIISSDLNGFQIMIEHRLGDLCHFIFDEDKSDNLKERICPSLHTEIINELWRSRPLETWLEGVSRNSRWLIKAQSSQDNNEGHKTKELSGRCRGIHVAWSCKGDPHKRAKWNFERRKTRKLALVLDGDWDEKKKQNLYEAGWDWVGDVSELDELRELIQSDS